MTDSTRSLRPRTSVRTLWRWLIAFVAFPLGGLAALLAVGPVVDLPTALIGGLLTGSVIGLGQWFALRGRVSVWWILATAIGLAVGLAVGVLAGGGYSLPVIAGASALAVAVAQIVVTPPVPRMIWAPVVTAAWLLGWLIAWSIGVDTAQNFTVFGASGAALFTVAIALVAWTMPARAVAA